jgi:hypothetical protein
MMYGERFDALEARIKRLEEMADGENKGVVSGIIEGATTFAFNLLLHELERACPSFSVTRFRDEFRRISLASIAAAIPDAAGPRQSEARRVLRQAAEERLEDLISDLIPPSIHD